MSDMPTDEEMDASNRGQEAYYRGTPKDCNPYPEHRSLHDFWIFGWEGADSDSRAQGKDITEKSSL